MMDLNTPWREATFVGFDTETSGKYPLDSEICEIAAVKWQGGRVVAEFQSLVAVSKPMSNEVIQIHNITNEMLIGAPSIRDAISKFHAFIEGSFLIAHHAPFDLGFVAHEFERVGLTLPKAPVFCSSILSRRAFPQSPNHRLQTLIEFFKLEKGKAHRALDDAKACLEVALRVYEKVGADVTIQSLLTYQTTRLEWSQFSTQHLRANPVFAVLLKALEKREILQIVYEGGSRPGQARTVTPMGLVRTPIERAAIVNAEGGGDFLVALEEGETMPKRYFLKKISAARL
jgi:DNA polymerase III subunit epsilon